MKRFLALLLAALLALLCGCGDFVSLLPGTELPRAAEEQQPVDPETEPAFEARPLLSFVGLDALADSYYSDTPAALSYQSEAGEGGIPGCRAYVFDRASVIAACDALRTMTVTDRARETPAPGGVYTLSMADGREYAFAFGVLPDGARALRDGDRSYIVEGGEALWALEFPSYSASFDLFDLYFDDGVRAFADGFYENTPVSVGLRLSSGATITSEDPEIVREAFRILSYATVTVVEDRPDQNIDLTDTRDYVFTMEDGTYYTFSFAQHCLAVRMGDFGTVYYWLADIAPLFELAIVPASNAGNFAGGAIAELREDIARAAAVVRGETDELTVAGVFVEFDIDGENSYITLSGDEALSFLSSVFAVPVSADAVAEPSGDKITVSVTLSDMTGPILYFTGDSIQQVVGVSYACGGAEMSALRDTILSLAAAGGNQAEVSEGGTD